jgi:hypothetical protein
MTEKTYNFGSPDDQYDEGLLGAVNPVILDSIERYVQTGCGVGNFLTAVIDNDLREAVSRADEDNLRSLHNIVKVLYNYCPRVCWGCSEVRRAWQRVGGCRGIRGEVTNEAP